MSELISKHTIKFFYSTLEGFRQDVARPVSLQIANIIMATLAVLLFSLNTTLTHSLDFYPHTLYTQIGVLLASLCVIGCALYKVTYLIHRSRLRKLKSHYLTLANDRRLFIQEQLVSSDVEDQKKVMALMITAELLEEIIQSFEDIDINSHSSTAMRA